MRTSRLIVPVAAALIMGVSLASHAAGNGKGGGGSHGNTAKSAQHSSAKAKAKAKVKAKPAAHGKRNVRGKHTKGTDNTSAKGRHTVADQLAARPQLAERLAPLIHKDTADLPAAVAGFKNFGQFVAAAHASDNLGIPFDALKAEITKEGGSLGKGIQTLSPDANVDAEIFKANTQAQDDLMQPS